MSKVLVVDDHKDIASNLAALLLSMGHEARFATSSAAALTIAASFRADIAFIDIIMPEVDGFECARRLCQSLDRPIRLFAMSGHVPSAWPENPLLFLLFEKYLVKPVLSKVIVSLIGDGDRR